MNRVWRKDGNYSRGKKSVSFNDRGGGIKKRLGPKVGGGGGANLRNVILDDDDEGMGGTGTSYQSGRARPAM